LVVFYDPHVRRLLGGVFACILNTIYYFCLSDVRNNAMFATTLLTTAYAAAVEGTYTSICMAMFNRAALDDIVACDRAMTFNGEFKAGTEVLDSIDRQKHNVVRDIIRHWKCKAAEDIVQSIDDKSLVIFKVFEEHMDNDKDRKITYDEFVRFSQARQVFDIDTLWNLFIHDDGRNINLESIKSMLYHVLFKKKNFAHGVDTDIMLSSWITWYVFLFTFPLLCIILSSIWGYEGAFQGGSLSLFEIYVLTSAFAAKAITSNLRFIMYMVIARPFNIGDLLFIGNDIYKLTHLSPTFVSCLGRDVIVIKNSQLIDDTIRNYSRTFINDSVSLELPLNTHNDLACTIYNRMIEYASENCSHIDSRGIRCGWVDIRNNARVLQCNWKYSFLIYDRARFNAIRTMFVDTVIKSTINDVSRSVILSNASQGSAALTPMIVDHFSAFAGEQLHHNESPGRGLGAATGHDESPGRGLGAATGHDESPGAATGRVDDARARSCKTERI
jgi:small-conductance mechanosensitive channel